MVRQSQTSTKEPGFPDLLERERIWITSRAAMIEAHCRTEGSVLDRMIHRENMFTYEDRIRRAKYLGALADRIFRKECVRLGLDADEAIKSPCSTIGSRQCGIEADEQAEHETTSGRNQRPHR